MNSKKIFLRTVTHLREGDHGPRPHQLIDRCPSQKQKPGSDRDSNVGDESIYNSEALAEALCESRIDYEHIAALGGLREALCESRIDYEHIAALGGLRGRKRDVPANVNAFWQNQRFHNYADYAMSEDFHSGLIRLRELGHATLSFPKIRSGRIRAVRENQTINRAGTGTVLSAYSHHASKAPETSPRSRPC
jgi:hypothetical protein